jgi:invasion protein IalB
MRRIAARLAAILIALAPASPAWGQPAAEPQAFGVWRLQCLPPGDAARPPTLAPGAPFCILGQLVTTDEERRQVVLAATVDFAEGPDTPVLRFRMASAIRRESGLGLKPGDHPEMRLPILACDQRVCIAAGRLTPEVQARLEASRSAEVNFMMADGRMLPVPLGLAGFAEGMAALREAQARP